ncbi:FAD:protein FMN transferase [Microbacterium saccharophilum]|uniref:FAD:protein FMN transferase n=1 Tax=Microbacterium saccharophilum TaxID=1213358 RepID=A0A5C8I9G7_9MICO|nr:FAD:protein FMN transferase [Microbacterium saccharophilum]TXK15053.1 FAD:protein FMN transferase [Microbacterium saccharophilum]GEP47460.1 FAD:protein FMN transferase [Microbacterium saccharophilum]
MSPVIAGRPHRQVWTEQIMGTVVSIHAVTRTGAPERGATEAAAAFAALREVDRVFSTYRDDSDISRLRRGECAVASLDPRVAEVAAACTAWEAATAGRFSADWRGWFDPTGFVKGWAVESAARAHLAPLLADDEVVAVGINAGGDLQLYTAPGADWVWHVGIADPTRPGVVLATVDVVDGAVATSGLAERGAHIIDPRSGAPARGVASATVIADGLAAADVWATSAVVAGMDELAWIQDAGTRTGILIGDDGRVRRWIRSIEVSVVGADPDLATIA